MIRVVIPTMVKCVNESSDCIFFLKKSVYRKNAMYKTIHDENQIKK